ncbi:MAG: hypothetical protein EKK34_12700 [Mycobacterium sp.]|nr:MAG: hypothetical protein EKK34_12700 [Mycobacterium sp.]
MPKRDLWRKTGLCTESFAGHWSVLERTSLPQRMCCGISLPGRRFFTPEKGRPPPGGEEAEVVVYQPRGVGLIHPRLKAE